MYSVGFLEIQLLQVYAQVAWRELLGIMQAVRLGFL
jgi:hypothetical protein